MADVFCNLLRHRILHRRRNSGKFVGWKANDRLENSSTVLLAILAPIITLSFAFLLTTAFSISWWRAAESGATIAHLN